MAAVTNENVSIGSQLTRELEDQKRQLKVTELIAKVLNPPDFSREDVIKIHLQATSTPSQGFPLLIELFKIKVAAAKQAGLSPQACIEEFEHVATSQNTVLTGENSDIKNALAVLRFTIDEAGRIMYVRDHNISPVIDLEKLQRETGVSFVDDKNHLVDCVGAYAKVFKQKRDGAAWGFYETTLRPNFHKVLDYLEKEGDLDRIQQVFNIYISCLVPEFDVWKSLSKNDGPIAKALPYIAKYGSLDQVEPLYQLRNWPSWEKAYHWIDLQCQAAEILASIDREKAQQYIARAEKDLKEKFVTSFWNRSAPIEEAREDASARIEKAKLALQQRS